MKEINNEIDMIFSSFFNREPFRSTEFLEDPESRDLTTRDLRQPLSDILEDDKEITVNMQIPGVEKQDIMITVKDGGIEVKAQKKHEYKEEDKEKGFYRFERRHASFYRYFSLTENADVEDVDASYEDGILKLKIPKKKLKEEERKRIEVK